MQTMFGEDKVIRPLISAAALPLNTRFAGLYTEAVTFSSLIAV